MSEEASAAPAEAPESPAKATEETTEERVPYERFQKANQKAKEAAERAAKLEGDLEAIRRELEDREAAGLPELERERKRAEALEKRIAEAEARAAESEQRVARTQREQWVSQAAAAMNFANPARAAKLIDDLDSIEDSDQAERAVKRLAKSDSYLIKADDTQPKIGRVLENGKTVQPGAKTTGRINPEEEAGMIAANLKKFTETWQSAGS